MLNADLEFKSNPRGGQTLFITGSAAAFFALVVCAVCVLVPALT